uniref:Intelectin-like protein n=1 Tax=Phallusia mammillata TaxID=59560 RepID=A0A6F9DEW5_9ASCI|nr:intelectin-like protein [Phallusia mammillata]
MKRVADMVCLMPACVMFGFMSSIKRIGNHRTLQMHFLESLHLAYIILLNGKFTNRYPTHSLVTQWLQGPDCTYDDDVLSVPVQFSIGNDSVVNSMLPPSVNPLPTGFVQLRAYGRTGSVYAMCPAVQVNDWRSEYVCIGGMKNPDSRYYDDCSDFTNWDGLPKTLLHETTPVDYAHFQRDLDSTIMIFYR